jgi:peptide/nickel transport system substrate-binding protein
MGRLRHLLIGAGLVGTLFLSGSSIDYFEEQLPSTMNPLYARTMVDRRSHELVFDRLFYRSAITNELRSRVVERYQILEGGKKIKLTLKDGIKWHDGKPLKASDVCFSVDAMLNPNNPSNESKDYRESLAGCEADDKERAATVAFRKIYHNPRERVAFHILPAHAFDSATISPDDDFSLRPVGTGAMKGGKGRREVSFTHVPNAHHQTNVTTMQLKEGGDPFVQVRTLINAGVQGVISVAPPLRPEVAASDDVALKSYDLRSWWFIAVNTKSKGLARKEVRQAIDLTLDRAELRELTIGVDKNDPNPPCEFISGPFVQSSPYYNRQVKVVERSDRARASQLMEKAGAKKAAGRWTIDGAPVNLKLGMNAPLDTEAKDLLNQIGNQLQAGGFDRQVYKVAADKWNREVVSGQMEDYDLLIGKWSFGLVEYVNPLFHTRKSGKGSLNIFNYSDPEVDKILARFDAARTDTEARDAYHDLHAKLAEELPYIFLWKLDTKSAWRNEVRNNTIAPYYYFTEFDGWTLQ